VAHQRFRYLYRNALVLNLRLQAEGHPAVDLERFLLPAYFELEYWEGMSDGGSRP
jgi:hypothetical protein